MLKMIRRHRKLDTMLYLQKNSVISYFFLFYSKILKIYRYIFLHCSILEKNLHLRQDFMDRKNSTPKHRLWSRKSYFFSKISQVLNFNIHWLAHRLFLYRVTKFNKQGLCLLSSLMQSQSPNISKNKTQQNNTTYLVLQIKLDKSHLRTKSEDKVLV